MSDDWKRDRFGSLERGENPTVLARMKSGYAVIGDTQFLPGYCVLLAYPKVEDLNQLSFAARTAFLLDMSLLGDAIQAACSPARVNYSIYGNSDSFLHAHVFPRYEWEPEERRRYPIWQYPRDRWFSAEYVYADEKHGQMRQAITERLLQCMQQAYGAQE